MHDSLITRTTNITVLIGLLFSGGLLIGLLGLQMLICSLGVDCPLAWRIVQGATWAGFFTLPISYTKYIRRNFKKINVHKYKFRLKYATIVFNLLMIVCIQLGIGLFFTTPEALCYAHDGQVGFELIFTGMAAVPFLIILGVIFQRYLNRLIAHNIEME